MPDPEGKQTVVKKTEKKQRSGNPNPKAGPGRPAGVPNRISGIAKDNIAKVFEMVGGITGMAAWAKDNRTEFYKHYARLIPVQVSGDQDNPLLIKDVTASILAMMTPEQLEQAKRLAAEQNLLEQEKTQ